MSLNIIKEKIKFIMLRGISSKLRIVLIIICNLAISTIIFIYIIVGIKHGRKFDLAIDNEYYFYNQCVQNKYKDNFNKPYNINGFKYVEGEWNTGFVIEDKIGNQYVWVPISNNSNNGIPKLLKKNFSICPNIPIEDCFDEKYENFIISALKNGGFYISRYELGIGENGKIVSKANKELLMDLSKAEFLYKINDMYSQEDFSCELINGYAYDSTLEWIINDDNIKTFYIKQDSKVLTGRNSNKNIYDLFDNIFEYTIETSFETNIIRGVLEEKFSDEESRYALLPEEKTFFNDKVGARIIIYK